jgi:hypothetical protein
MPLTLALKYVCGSIIRDSWEYHGDTDSKDERNQVEEGHPELREMLVFGVRRAE